MVGSVQFRLDFCKNFKLHNSASSRVLRLLLCSLWSNLRIGKIHGGARSGKRLISRLEVSMKHDCNATTTLEEEYAIFT